ncbi:membrane protein [Blastococcus aggregatus]|uniref:Membrane protein n=1 Tax=Blastococcus aggregatus TaxID=38502 RepID=A0A285V7I2_9ACTN|nr:YihY/virulence factor BrkB family protein [Blastococcus aggregatus]SOC50084.1 membrane protein [Blastococcus aggregatus]
MARCRRFLAVYVAEVNRDRLLGLAAEAAFFAVLSLFPSVLVAASILGLLDVLVGADVAGRVQEDVVSALDAVFTDSASGAVQSVESLFDRAGGELFTVAVAGALVTISGAFAVVINALNIAYDTVERRTWIRRRLLGLGMGVATTVVAALALTVLVVGPFLGRGPALADAVGLGAAFAFTWDVLRYPLLIGGLVVWAATLFHYAPNRRTPWREALPGGLLTTALWLLATAGFHFYLRIAAAGNPVLGAFGGGVIVMMWTYLLSLALMLGGELNATLHPRHAPDRRSRPTQEHVQA